jgi:nucleoside-diphosphate-sugar epimerase
VVTGSAGHLGEALARVLRDGGHDVTGIDLRPSPCTTVVGSVADRALVRRCLAGLDAVLHTATLHKPHVGSHGKQAFVDTNVTTPFTPGDLAGLRDDAPVVVRRLFPDYEAEYARRGWRMFPSIGRVYVNASARAELGWTPRRDFRSVLDALKSGEDPRSPLARAIGAKGYHDKPTGVYTS